MLIDIISALANENMTMFSYFTYEVLVSTPLWLTWILICLINQLTQTEKKTAKYQVPNNLTASLIVCILLAFVQLTVLLFLTPIHLVTFGAFLRIISEIILIMVFLYILYDNYEPKTFGCSNKTAIKIFWSLKLFDHLLILAYRCLIHYELLGNSCPAPSPFLFLDILALLYFICPYIICYKLEKSNEEPILINTELKNHPYDKAGILSKIFMQWALPLMKLGQTKALTLEDIPDVRSENRSEQQVEKIRPVLMSYISDLNVKQPVLKTVWHIYWKEIVLAYAILNIRVLFEFQMPVFIIMLEQFLYDQEIPLWRGLAIATYIVIFKLIEFMLMHNCDFWFDCFNRNLRSGLQGVVYEKILRSGKSQVSSEFSFAHITNIAQTDLDRIAYGACHIFRSSILPLKLILGLYTLKQTVDWEPALAALLVMFISFGIHYCIVKGIHKTHELWKQKRDDRLKYINELLNFIKVFKLYNWENQLSKRVYQARDEETGAEASHFKYVCMIIFMLCGARGYLLLAIIATKIYFGQVLHAGAIFSGLCTVGILQQCFTHVPDVISFMEQIKTSLNNYQSYMRSHDSPEVYNTELGAKNSNMAVGIEKANFMWKLEGEEPFLKNINLQVPKGQFVGVVGKVGQGKSSLLHALLNDMVMTGANSQIFYNGSVSFVSQESWIQNATLRDNILFGKVYDEDAYNKVIEVCELIDDLKVMPSGDMTEIGEKGINLSGGQKARVAIARAVYANTDIIILDDPLSAVDAHVAKNIFHNCLKQHLSGHTIIMATNSQQLFPYIDRLLVLNNGEIVEEGSYSDLISANGYFANEYCIDLNHEEHEATTQGTSIVVESAQGQDKMIEEEDRAVGDVDSNLYYKYVEYLGGAFAVIAIGIFYFSEQAFRLSNDFFMPQWTNESYETQQEHNIEYFWYYLASTLGFSLSISIRHAVLMYFGMKAASKIFRGQIQALLNAPINNYYDITPIGRIINRLSNDMQKIDADLFFTLHGCIDCIFEAFVTYSIAIYFMPYIVLALPIVFYIMLKIQRLFQATQRELIRLESICKSPIISHFSATYNGSQVIRSFGYQQQFIEKNAKLLDIHSSIIIMQQGVGRWLGTALQFTTIGIFYAIMLFVVLSRGVIESGVGVVILLYAQGLPWHINGIIHCIGHLQNQFVGFERTQALTQIVQEKPRVTDIDKSVQLNKGSIKFENFQMRYRENTELVLKGVNCEIKPSEKIGVVGRTGSGKSSLCMGLFRIVEASSGAIYIDDINIADLGLDKLRDSLCVIPQDPTLFQGKMRYNIDPFDEKTDEQLCRAIQMLIPDQDPMEFLNSDVEENGGNFSVGQRQLVCIARAIVRDVKIMFLDEATASVDYRTDELIQKALRENFNDRTVLTIAHRLNTIMDYDKVLVMDQGKVAEFDTPANLIAQRGIFYDLVSKSGNKLQSI